MDIRDIPLDRIKPPKLRPRFGLEGPELDELAASMQRVGLIQPIVVAADDDGYRIIAGNRRYHAARKLGWKTIRAIVADYGEQTEEVATIVENMHRMNLNPIEEALMLAQIIKQRGWTHEEMAEAIGKSRVWVTKRLMLLDLDDNTIKDVIQGNLSPTHALELGRIKDPNVRDYYRQLAIRHGVTSQVLHAWVDDRLARERASPEPMPPPEPGYEPPPPEPVKITCIVCDRDQDQVILRMAWLCRECAQRLERIKQQEV